jgi:hypothetical protein
VYDTCGGSFFLVFFSCRPLSLSLVSGFWDAGWRPQRPRSLSVVRWVLAIGHMPYGPCILHLVVCPGSTASRRNMPCHMPYVLCYAPYINHMHYTPHAKSMVPAVSCVSRALIPHTALRVLDIRHPRGVAEVKKHRRSHAEEGSKASLLDRDPQKASTVQSEFGFRDRVRPERQSAVQQTMLVLDLRPGVSGCCYVPSKFFALPGSWWCWYKWWCGGVAMFNQNSLLLPSCW